MAVTDFMRGLRPRSGRLPVLRRHGVAAPTRAAVARGLTLAGPVVCLAAVVVTATGAPGEEAFGRALFELLIVGVPMAAGIYALRAGTDARFALALIAFSLAWSLTALAETPASVPYTIGRLATWLVFPGVVYPLLTFPGGPIAKGLDRVLFVWLLALLVLLFFGTAPLVAAYPPKTLWASGTT